MRFKRLITSNLFEKFLKVPSTISIFTVIHIIGYITLYVLYQYSLLFM